MDLISIGQLVARRADKSFVRPPWPSIGGLMPRQFSFGKMCMATRPHRYVLVPGYMYTSIRNRGFLSLVKMNMGMRWRTIALLEGSTLTRPRTA
jgi:hypothetical protein